MHLEPSFQSWFIKSQSDDGGSGHRNVRGLTKEECHWHFPSKDRLVNLLQDDSPGSHSIHPLHMGIKLELLNSYLQF